MGQWCGQRVGTYFKWSITPSLSDMAKEVYWPSIGKLKAMHRKSISQRAIRKETEEFTKMVKLTESAQMSWAAQLLALFYLPLLFNSTSSLIIVAQKCAMKFSQWFNLQNFPFVPSSNFPVLNALSLMLLVLCFRIRADWSPKIFH